MLLGFDVMFSAGSFMAALFLRQWMATVLPSLDQIVDVPPLEVED